MAKKKPIQRKPRTHSRSENDYNNYLTTYWRPAMAWSYMAICLFDFIIAPTGTTLLISLAKANIPVWTSLTLSNGGIMHIAFGTILGVSAWGRTKEAVTNSQQLGPGGIMIPTQTIYTDTQIGNVPGPQTNVIIPTPSPIPGPTGPTGPVNQ